jgi:ParB family chromosome partitioning protein
VFYRYASSTCLELTAKSAGFSTQAPGLGDAPPAKAIDSRHQAWEWQLPEDPAHLWDALLALDSDSRATLFAHCAALTINVVKEPWNRRPGAMAHGDRLAQAVRLDMAAAGWAPTVDNYLSRVTKARILEAVREAKGDAAAQLIDHLKKPDMAREAERLLAGTGWLPEALRVTPVDTPIGETAAEALPAFFTEAANDGDSFGANAIAAE